jgi:hypothetical protein
MNLYPPRDSVPPNRILLRFWRPTFSRAIPVLFILLVLGLPRNLFLSCIPLSSSRHTRTRTHTEMHCILFYLFSYSIHATCPTHLVLVDRRNNFPRRVHTRSVCTMQQTWPDVQDEVGSTVSVIFGDGHTGVSACFFLQVFLPKAEPSFASRCLLRQVMQPVRLPPAVCDVPP